MNDPPHFSVIIPTRNRPDLLARALRSALAQQGAGFELIVADDGAGDGAAVARTFGTAGLDTFTTGGVGQVQARNMALRRASGRWIAWLDDDDWWATTDHLAVLGAALDAGGGLAYTSGRIVREGPGRDTGEEIGFTAHADAVSLRHDNTLLVSGIAYDRWLHDALGPFDETLSIYWDWDWYLRLASAEIRFADARSQGVRISARGDTASAAANEPVRRTELARLCAQHGLSGVVLKNHEAIAIEQRGGGSGP